ncbi:MAG: hypothetical protein JW720_07035 [Sedimentisphaerales bacterium]|nr:hypothetical protein [Sedimentisphaerales bacterium]
MMVNSRVCISGLVLITIVGVFLSSAGTACGEVRLPAVIGDNMVLQQGGKVPIWGWAEPNEEIMVSVSWHSMQWGVTANEHGKWQFSMDAPKAGGPYEITLRGKNTITIRNILVGEVWVCSGQSNMEMSVYSSANAQEEISAAKYPNIRLFTVQKKIADSPESDCVGQWQQCSPQTVGGFSAVGYFFGRKLHKELNVPVGLINTSWGGTVAEAWTRAGALETMPYFKRQMDAVAAAKADPEVSMAKYREELAQWQEKINEGNSKDQDCIAPGFDDTGWKEMALPGLWETTELGNFDGLVWFRRTFEVPENMTGKEMVLSLGPIDDMDSTWVNGVRVGGLEGPGTWMAPREYKFGGDIIKAGRNVIVVRVLDTGGGGGIYGQPEQMMLKDTGGAGSISLSGKWRYKVGYDIKSMPSQPSPPAWANNPNAPTVLYNGMIAPLIPFGIKGAIWYQGESNAGRAYQYRESFPLMITNWREDWERGDFPFLFVQLANFMAVKDEPGESAWAELREAQLRTLSLPNTGQAVIIDIGDAEDIHPKNKQDVGKRLALWALGNSYGKSIVYSGPLYKSMKADGGKIILSFDHVGGGLVAKGGGSLKGFAIAGEDKKFVWADAKIEGDKIVVSSDAVAAPAAVRYAWADNPVCNLYNAEGLPASPFRTDDWPGVTAAAQ